MRKFLVGVVVAGIGALGAVGGAGAQTAPCPGSPQVVCPSPSQTPRQPAAGARTPAPSGAVVEARDQVARPAASPRRARQVRASDSRQLPVTGSDVTVLLATGVVLVAGGAGLVLRSRHEGSHAG